MEPGRSSGSGGSRIGLLIVIVLVVAGAAGAWLYTRGKLPGVGSGRGAESGAAMAALVPQESQVFLAVDLRGRWKGEALVAKLEELRSQAPELAKKLDEAEKKGGVSLKSLARWVEPSGCLVIFPREGQKGLFPASMDKPVAEMAPELVLMTPVRDEAAAKADLQALAAKAPEKPREVQVEGVACFQAGPADPAPTWGVAEGWLLFGSSTTALGRTLKTVRKKAPALAEDATFKEARSRVTVRADGFAYVRAGSIFESLVAFPPAAAYTDHLTKAAAEGIQYKVAAVDLTGEESESQAFLKLDAKSQSDFIKAMLAPLPAPRSAMTMVPAKWGQCSVLNATWVGKVYYELACLFPRLRPQVAAAPTMISVQLGFNPFAKFQEACTGEALVSTNALEQQLLALKGLGSSFEGARGQGQLTACKSNLKNIGTALEMYSTDNGGRFPTQLSQLTPNYLKMIPTCPAAGRDTYTASFSSGASPDRYKVFCQGHHHETVGGPVDQPLYTSEQGLVYTGGPAPVASQGPSMPTPSYLVVLPVKDPAAATDLIGQLEKAARMESRVTKRVGEVDLHAVGTLPVCWAKVEKPVKAVVVSLGANAEARVEEALESSSHAADSMESQKLLADMLKEAKGEVVWADYTDFTRVLQVAAELLESLPMASAPPEVKGLLSKVSAAMKGQSLASASVLTVESDGLRYRGKGLNMAMLTAGTAVGAAILVPNFIRARGQGQLTACKSNLKNIGTALEMYSTDHGGRFPTRLEQLTPDYLRLIPTCPAAGSSTYVQGFQSAAGPDAYTVVCTGHHHAGVGQGSDFPQYTSTQGLISQ